MIDLKQLCTVDLREEGRRVREADWTAAHLCNDWRNHIDQDIRDAWPSLSDEARGLAYVIADMEAHDEEWD